VFNSITRIEKETNLAPACGERICSSLMRDCVGPPQASKPEKDSQMGRQPPDAVEDERFFFSARQPVGTPDPGQDKYFLSHCFFNFHRRGLTTSNLLQPLSSFSTGNYQLLM